MNDLHERVEACPFCGEAALIRHDENGYGVCCSKCFGEVREVYREKDDAVIAWNRRALLAPREEPGLREAVLTLKRAYAMAPPEAIREAWRLLDKALAARPVEAKAEAVGAAGTFNAIYEIATRALAESHTEDTRALVEICNICEGLSDGPAPADALREARGYFWADPRLKGITLASDQFALVIQSIAAWEKMYAVKHTADRQQMAVDIMHSGLLQRMLLGDGEVYESAALRESAKEET